MTSVDGLARVFSPIRIGPHELRNRVAIPAHTLLFGERHVLSDRHVAYYRERALGGTGLIIVEGGSVHRESRGAFIDSIAAYDERAIPQYAKLADACHEHGTVVFSQLFSLGVHMRGTYELDDWVPLWAPSRVPSVRDREVPLAMEAEHIRALVHGFGRSARNLETAGLDGVELHAAHSYLLGAFLSPAYNRRTDAYGGSVANRARLVLECAEEVRHRTGSGLALGVRLSFDEWLGEHGITAEASEETLELLAASGLFDFVNVSSGGYHSIHKSVAPMVEPAGFTAPLGERAKRAVGERLVVLLAGRITTLSVAERLLADGATDVVCMARAHMADPFLVRKALEGRAHETTLCVGANDCLDFRKGRHITCLVNPALGREGRWGHGTLRPALPSRSVLVVGGGPAGMRAAGVAAQRGHRVLLVEAAAALGGHLRLLAGLPARGGWEDAIANLSSPLSRHGVDVRLATRVDAALVASEAPDVVVCATGATWDRTGFTPLRPDRDGIPGAHLDLVWPIDLAIGHALASGGTLGERVLIYDESGEYLPVGLADLLSAQGVAVELVTPNATVAETLALTGDAPYVLPRLVASGVRLTPQRELDAITADGEISLRAPWCAGDEKRRVDAVVLCQYRTPDDALYRELGGVAVALHRIGDCLAPRRTGVAIYEGEQLGRVL